MNDVRRIAFVAEHFFELQGLAPAIFGGTLIFSTLLHHAIDAPGRFLNTSQAFMLSVMASNFALVTLQKMYRRTYGDIVATRTARFVAGLPLIIVYAGWLTEMFLSFDGPYSGPSLAAVALAAVSCWIALRDWPWRVHHLVPAAAGLAAAIITASVPPSPNRVGVDPARGEAYLLAYALMGFGVVFSGLLDHRLLAASFGHPSGTTSVPASRVPASFWIGLSIMASAGACLWLSERALPFALPLIVMLGPVAVTFIASLGQTARAFRDLGRRRPTDVGHRLRLDGDVMVVVLSIALAGTVDSALFASGSPRRLIVAIGVSSLWLAAAKFRERWHCLLWTLAAGVTLYATPGMSPARGFTVLIVTMASAFTLTGLVRSRHAFSLHRSDHADTI